MIRALAAAAVMLAVPGLLPPNGCVVPSSPKSAALAMKTGIGTLHLAPGCHRTSLERTSGAVNMQVVFCLPGPRPAGATRLLVVNDGSDGDFDRGDVFLSFWVVPNER